jgi:hypothetical protein
LEETAPETRSRFASGKTFDSFAENVNAFPVLLKAPQMAQYLITYDLHKVRNYQPLYHLMAGWSATRLTESLWLANLVGPAAVIRDVVSSTLDNDDTVAVIQLQKGTDWATVRVPPAATGWLSAYVTPAEIAA